jgi:hypothetical protein
MTHLSLFNDLNQHYGIPLTRHVPIQVCMALKRVCSWMRGDTTKLYLLYRIHFTSIKINGEAVNFLTLNDESWLREQKELYKKVAPVLDRLT